METKVFYVNRGQDNLGPFSMDVIVSKVVSGELKATDYIYLDDQDEWILICEHGEFVKKYEGLKKAVKPVSPPEVPGDLNDLTKEDWYILKDKNRFGPYPFVDVVRMLHEKTVFEYTYVWCRLFKDWKRIAEVPDFSLGSLHGLFAPKEVSDTTGKFFRRHFQRRRYECSILVHNNSKVWKGRSVELSEGGAAVVMEDTVLTPGQNVYIHFKPGLYSKPFNVLSEVVTKRYMKSPNGKVDENSLTSIIYGVRFINMQNHDRERLKSLDPAA